MSFISFCFLVQWPHCVLGWEFKSQGLGLAQFYLFFTVFVFHNLKEPKDDSFLSFLTIFEDDSSCYNFFQKDFP